MSRRSSSAADPARRAILWLSPAQASLGGAIADEAGLAVTAVGCPQRGRVTAPGSMLGVETTPDLRLALADHPDAALIALALGPDDREVLADPDARALSRDAPIFLCDPVFASMAAFARTAHTRPAWVDRLHWTPAFSLSPGGASALGARETFGRIRSIDLAARSARGVIGLPTLLLDAMAFIAAALGEPEYVDASISGLDAPSSLRLTPGDSILAIAGDLTAHLRFSDDRAAAVSLSDQAGAWFRGATLLGPGGCIRCDDSAVEWLSPAGELVERTDTPAGAAGVASLIAQQIRARPAADGPIPLVRRLTAWAIADAALLSARTGQPESPATIRRMTGVA